MAAYGAVLAVLWVVSWRALELFGIKAQGHPGFSFAGDGFLGGWVRYDGGWYVGIAESGYSYVEGAQASVAFFPAYPLAVRGVGRILDNYPVAGVVVTVLCGALAAALFWRWARARLSRDAALTALLLLLLYPYGWYLYGAVYGDALFLAASLGAFLLLERDRPLLAGLAGVVATAARPVGIAVVLGLLVHALERRQALTVPDRQPRLLAWAKVPTRLDLKRAKPRDAAVLVSVGGLATWCAYLWIRFGDPFLFSTVEAHWGQPSTPYTWFKITFFKLLFRGDDRVYAWGLVVQALLALAVLASVPFVARRFGWGYGTFVLVLVAVPMVGSKDFQGLGRYVIAAFPVFALAGETLAERPGLRRVLLPCCAVALMGMTAAFSHGVYLS